RGGRRNEQQRVAVGRRVDHGLDGDIAAGARLVFDHDRLAESLRQPRSHDPRDDIGPAAGRKSDDPAQRPRRIGLRAGATRYGGKGAGGAREIEKSTAGKMHGAPSPPAPAVSFYDFTSFAPVTASRFL